VKAVAIRGKSCQKRKTGHSSAQPLHISMQDQEPGRPQADSAADSTAQEGQADKDS
jgi:hypothetical protein